MAIESKSSVLLLQMVLELRDLKYHLAKSLPYKYEMKKSHWKEKEYNIFSTTYWKKNNKWGRNDFSPKLENLSAIKLD